MPLLYHVSGYERYDEVQHKNLHYVPVSKILEHITKLAKRFKFVDADTYFEKTITSDEPLACLTFDDGYIQTWKTIIPELERLKIPSTFYVNSSLVKGQSFWRDNVRKLISSGLTNDFINHYDLVDTFNEANFYRSSKNASSTISSKDIKKYIEQYFKTKGISNQENVFCGLEELRNVENYEFVKLGNHSNSHLVMSSLDYQEQEEEIGECHSFLYSHFEPQVISNIFSMPFGGADSYNNNTIEILQKFKFGGSFVSASNFDSDRDRLNTPETFKTVGRYLPKHYLKIW